MSVTSNHTCTRTELSLTWPQKVEALHAPISRGMGHKSLSSVCWSFSQKSSEEKKEDEKAVDAAENVICGTVKQRSSFSVEQDGPERKYNVQQLKKMQEKVCFWCRSLCLVSKAGDFVLNYIRCLLVLLILMLMLVTSHHFQTVFYAHQLS